MRRLVHILTGLLVLLTSMAFIGCKDKGGGGYCLGDCSQDCGNGHCELGETYDSCLQDCAPGCGDGECSALEANLTNPCPEDCAPVCGNDHLDDDEWCDDGNNVPGDGCNPYCDLEDGYEPHLGCHWGFPNGACELTWGETPESCPDCQY
jgi:cysteine-rich repeat protein